jgi:hypothetical protein
MASFDLIDTAMKGELVPVLLDLRSEGLSHDAIAHWLAEQGFIVSREMVRRWFRDIEAKAAS